MASYSPRLVRTSMSLDTVTLGLLDELAKRESISKSEVMRRAVRKLKEESDREDHRLSPLAALEWLQKRGGLDSAESDAFKSAIREERDAKRYWWEA
ncbi:ribbon-helix-helix protein, CopG family [Luteolibacter flavescens]|uniref:Ribbon-helix-helix protein, CopG family n=1 Tax=Luteolibacter flavescens TaxID=1859460 RepID=A0ABT3FP89_9BACT|nr:ribbon-helix-helix protein, CopG family [Luteolibacter flavescens]MCW1885262.1 ribbon-helix-helix protein, CopG family [Luteolibacter flavescens]